MDKNGYQEWVNEVLVAYLNADHMTSQVVIEEPVKVWVRSNGLLLSMVDMDAKFRQPGIKAFRSWFEVSSGNQHEGLSRAVMTTEYEGRKSILRHLETTGLINKVPCDDFSFVAGIRHRIKRYEAKEADANL